MLSILKNILFGISETEEETRLNARIELRLRAEEKALIKTFADLRGVSSSKLIRIATLKYIDDVIKIND